MPELLDALDTDDRQTWDALDLEKRDTLTAIYQTNLDQHGQAHALEVVRRSLHDQREAQAPRAKPPGTETARTDDAAQTAQFSETNPLEQAAPALDVDELADALDPQERKTWDDLDDASQADLLKEIQDLPDKLTQLKNRLRKQRLSRCRRPDDETIHAEGKQDNKGKRIEPLPVDREALDKTLLEATTPATVLKAVARLQWAETHDGEECPADQIPSEADLCGWTWKIPKEDKAKAADHVAAFLPPLDSYDYHDRDKAAYRWQWIQIADPAEPTEPPRLVVALINGNGVTGRVAFTASILDEKTGELVEAALILSLEQMQTTWCKVHRDRRPPHPLAPLVKAWQARPMPSDPFRPKNRASLPALNRRPKEAEQLNLIEAHQPVAQANGQQLLLDLPELTPAATGRSWLLDLFDRAGGQSMKQGRGAPWDMRLFVGAMLYTGIPDRDGQWHSFRLPTKEVIRWLHPRGWPNRARDWEQFPAALFRINRKLGFVAIDGLGYVQIIGATVIPKTPDDPHVEFIVRIPRCAAHGARIDWPTLCKYGQHSAVLYRAYLSAVEFMHLSAHNGQPITQDIGKPLLAKDGKPLRAKGGRVRRSTAEVVANSSTRYVRGLTEGELTEMTGFDPTDRKRRHDARRAFERLDNDGAIDLERDGKVWRIFGPTP